MTKTEEIGWQLAGVSSAKFGLDRPLRAGEFYVPGDIRLDKDRLRWDFDSDRTKTVRPEAGMLEHFVQLADASADKILAYARRWGVLEICKHDLPACHKSCSPLRSGGTYWEPLEAWRRFAKLFRALLDIAAQLAFDKPGPAEHWQVVGAYGGLGRGQLFGLRGVKADHGKLQVALNVLLHDARVRPIVGWRDGKWLIELTGGLVIGCSLFGALVCQLVLAISRTEGLAICSSCGMSYIPAKRPNPNRRSYCQKCRERKIPSSDAARDYRRRRKHPT